MSRTIPPLTLFILRFVCALLLLATAEGLRRVFASFKKPPAKVEQIEKTHFIKVARIERKNHLLSLEGYGVIQSSEIITLSSEVAGIITYVNDKMEPGFEIKKGEILFEIDKTDFELSVNLMKSKISVIEARIKESETDQTFVEKSISLYQKETELAEKEVKRQQDLLKKNIGSENNKELAEKALISAENMLLSARKQLSTLKSSVKTMQEQKKEAENSLLIESNKVSKCTITAPKDLRVVSRHIEAGQVATPQMAAVTLEDSKNLEIPVKISGPKIVKWLKLSKNENDLFKALQSTSAKIYWIEGDNLNELAEGTLTRIEKYNSQNRMIEAIVTLKKVKAVTATGMFCKVEISGKELQNVFRIPRVALTKTGQAMVIENKRIKFYPVEVIYSGGDFFMIKSDSLKNSHVFVNSKIASPVEGMKVEVEMPADEKG